VSLLPKSYTKMIDSSFFKDRIIHIEFLSIKNGKEVKMAHGSKKIKGEYIRNICENGISDLNQF
jgi:cytoplasmic iron level regulating protein YaaA (DUF328/UPF0246 family)